MTLRNHFIRSLKWSALGKVLSQVVSWSITILVIRMLSPTDYGLMAMAMVVITLLTHLNDFGLGSALVQVKEVDDRKIAAVFGVLLMLGLGLWGLLAAAAPLISLVFDEPRLTLLLSVTGFGFCIASLATVPEVMMRRSMNFKALAFADLSGVLTGSIATLIMAWYGCGVWALVGGNLMGAFVRMLALNLLNPVKLMPSLDLSNSKSFFRFGGNMTASRFAWWCMSQADILIAAKLFGKEALGIYSVALNLATLPMHKAMAMVNQVAFSAIARLQDQKAAAKAGLLEGVSWLGYVAIPALTGMALVAPEFVFVVLGPNWAAAVFPMQCIALVVPLRMLSAVLSTATNALGSADVDFRNTLTGTFVYPACFLFGAQWGVPGLAASWLVAVPLVFALNFSRTTRIIDLRLLELFKAVLNPCYATFAMALAILVLKYLFGAMHNAMLLGVEVGLGALIYTAALILLDKNARKLMLSAIRKFG